MGGRQVGTPPPKGYDSSLICAMPKFVAEISCKLFDLNPHFWVMSLISGSFFMSLSPCGWEYLVVGEGKNVMVQY